MLRQDVKPGAPYYFAGVTAGGGGVVRYRGVQGDVSTQISVTGGAPLYLRITRAGDILTAYASGNGLTWAPIAGSSVTVRLRNPVLAGLVVAAPDDTTTCTATFSAVHVVFSQTLTTPPTATPDLSSGELLAIGLISLGVALLYRRRRTRRVTLS